MHYIDRAVSVKGDNHDHQNKFLPSELQNQYGLHDPRSIKKKRDRHLARLDPCLTPVWPIRCFT